MVNRLHIYRCGCENGGGGKSKFFGKILKRMAGVMKKKREIGLEVYGREKWLIS